MHQKFCMSKVVRKFDGEMFVGLENPSFMKLYARCNGLGNVHMQDEEG
jgi:hypothetical protein